MIQHIELVSSGVLLYLLLCIVTCLTGYGLLRLLGLATASPALVLFAPGTALVFWSLAVGITVGLRVPMKDVTPWLWGVTAILALNGVRRPWPMLRFESSLLLICAILPVIVMARYFWHSIIDYSGSVAPDGWSYISIGQYMWEYPRGTEGGLAPLYQFGAQFSNIRYISSSLLGFFSPLVRAGDTQMVSSLYQSWALFCMACAVGFFWITETSKRWMILTATVLSTVAGWIANLIWANNFDNGLAMMYFPAFVGIINLLDVRNWRWWVLLGGMLAGIAYTYPELAPLIIACVILAALPRIWRDRHLWRAWLGGIAAGLAVALVLVLPVYELLTTFVLNQFATASAQVNRPGEGIFGGLLVAQYFPAALWGLGGEHQIVRFSEARNLLAIALTALAVLGMLVLIRRHKWGLTAAIVFMLGGALFFIIRQHYSYAAYKLIVISWWCVVAALITGVDWIIARVRQPQVKRIAATGLSLLILIDISQSNHINAETTFPYINSPNQMLSIDQFRQLRAIKEVVGSSPVTVLVDDWLSNDWAVYFLRDMPINLMVYRMYMAAPNIAPFMDRAQQVPLETTRYILTDSTFDGAASNLHPWKMIWSGGSYRLWDSGGGRWAAITTISNANGIEQLDQQRFFWLGQGDTSIDVLANEAGMLHIGAIFMPGPSVPNQAQRRVLLTTDSGYKKEIIFYGGDQNIALPVQAGTTKLVLSPLDQPTTTIKGDPRPLVLGVKGMTVSLDNNPVVVERIENPNGFERNDDQRSFFWMGNGSTTLRIQASQAGQIALQATFILGPSLPNVSQCQLMVESDTGYRERIAITAGEHQIDLPVRAGTTMITLTPLDTPTQLELANGDKRPLLLGVKGLTAQLEP